MSKYNRFIVINSIFTVIQILTVALLYFILYKILIPIIGLDLLGLWSLIFAISSIAAIGNLGFGGAILKYSAEFQMSNDYKKLNAVVNSSFLLIMAGMILVIAIIYFGSFFFIPYFVEKRYVSLALEIIPITLLSVFINVISGIYFSLIDGLNKSFYKSVATIIALIFFFFLSIFWVSEKGLYGLAYASLVQACIFFVLSIFSLFIEFPKFSFIYFKWNKPIMKEVMSYSLKFQTIGILTMVFEPVIKSLLSKYAGLDFVGIYELANKLVVQVRSLSSSIIMNLVPKIVRKNIHFSETQMIDVYKKINNINFILLWTLLMSLIPFGNLISTFLLGEVNSVFISSLYILTIGWMINSLNISAYTINVGTGNLKWNIISHLVYGLLNIPCLYIIGKTTNSGIYMLITGAIVSAIAGSVLIFEFHDKYKLSWNQLFSKTFLKYAVFFLIFFGLSYIIFENTNSPIIQFILLCFALIAYTLMIYIGIKDFRNDFNEILNLIFNRKKLSSKNEDKLI